MDNNYKNKNILITGGLGFLGSNLAHRLVRAGANVTILDNLDLKYGGNLFNIQSISKKVELIIEDVRNEEILIPLVERTDCLFHFAAQVSYIDSLTDPFNDLDLNARSSLLILELCRKYNTNIKIIFPSSRMVIGQISKKIFNEKIMVNPVSLYGAHKLLTEKYLEIYFREFGINYTVFRIMNPYGPRQQIKHSKYSLVGWFIRQAIDNNTIKIFGDGNQYRDYIYADDIIEAIFHCVLRKDSNGQIFNLGSGVAVQFREMAEIVIETIGLGKLEFIPWPDNYEKIETGTTLPDITKLKKISGFSPQVNLKTGIKRTYDYYKKYYDQYVK